MYYLCNWGWLKKICFTYLLRNIHSNSKFYLSIVSLAKAYTHRLKIANHINPSKIL